MPQLSRMVNRSKINDYFLDLAHLNAAACHLSYSKRWARRGSGGKDSPNGAYRSEGPCRFRGISPHFRVLRENFI